MTTYAAGQSATIDIPANAQYTISTTDDAYVDIIAGVNGAGTSDRLFGNRKSKVYGPWSVMARIKVRSIAGTVTVDSAVSTPVTATTNLTGGIELSAGGVALSIVQVVEQSAVPAALTGTTLETTLATVAIPAMGPNDSVRVTALFTFTSSTNLKTMFGKLNAATFAQNSTSTSGHTAARVQWTITNRNNTASQLGTVFGAGFTAGAAVTPLNPAVETSGNNTLLLRGQLALGTETITLEGYAVELLRG